MTLHKSMWKAVVLMGIAGVLVFAGGGFADDDVIPANITGITVPVTGATPAAGGTGTSEFTVTSVNWTPSASTFAAGTAYTAEITLTAAAGFTFENTAADAFDGKVAGATVTNPAGTAPGGTLLLNAAFPATAPAALASVTPANITGITVPVTGATPAAGGTGTSEFTVTSVNWTPSASTFAAGTAYTAEITLTAAAGFTFENTAADAFDGKVAGATVTNPAGTAPGGTLLLNAAFPATAPAALAAGGAGIIEVEHHGQTSVTLSWTAATGGSGSITYDVYYSETDNLSTLANTKTNGTKATTTVLAGHTYTVTGLTLGTDYYFNVLAKDAATPTPAEVVYVAKHQKTQGLERDEDDDLDDAEGIIEEALEGASPVAQATVGTETQAKTYIEGLIATYTAQPSGFDLNGVTPVVTISEWQSATEGASGTPAGVDGSFKYTVLLTKAPGSPRTVGPVLVEITATPYAGGGGNKQPSLARAPAPTAVSTTKNSITLAAVSLSGTVNGQTPEYALSTDNTEAHIVKSWQSGLTFTGLDGGKDYYAFARAAENATYNAGATSPASAKITTEADAPAAPAVSSVTVNPAQVVVDMDAVAAGGSKTQAFTATVVGVNVPLTTVTWSLPAGATGFSIDPNTGVLTIGTAATKGSSTTVTATAVETGVTDGGSRTGTAKVTVKATGAIAGVLTLTGGAEPKVGYALTANVTGTSGSGQVRYAWLNKKTCNVSTGVCPDTLKTGSTLAKSATYTPSWEDFDNGVRPIVRVVQDVTTGFLEAETKADVNANELFPASLLMTDSTVVSYAATKSYTVDGPKVSTDGGSIDTIIYRLAGADETPGDLRANITSRTAKGAKITFGVSGVGKAVLYATVRGKKNNVPWQLADVRVPITIIPKKLTSSDVKFEVISGKTVVYDGKAKNTTEKTTLIVKDGTVPLVEGEDYEVYPVTLSANGGSSYTLCGDGLCNNVYAGDAYLVIRGLDGATATYSRADVAIGKYTIGRRPITVVAAKFAGKQYDGTNAVIIDKESDGTEGTTARPSKDSIIVSFVDTAKAETGAAKDSVLKLGRDFTISNAVYSGKDVASALTGSATVALTANGLVSKNYSLASGSISRAGLEITKRVPKSNTATTTVLPTQPTKDSLVYGDTATFKYAWNTNHFDMSKSNPSGRRGIGSVTLKDPMSNPGGTLTVLYNYSKTKADFDSAGKPGKAFEGDTTRAPILAGSYIVKVKIAGNGSNIGYPSSTNSAANIDSIAVLGTYVINKPVKADITGPASDTAITVRQGRAVNLTVKATSPNSGVLSYQWFEGRENADPVKVGTNSSSYSANTSSMGTRKYYVVVTNSKSGIQDPDTAISKTFSVEVKDPPTTLNSSNGVVILSKQNWTYTGYQQTLSGSDVVVKYLRKDESGTVDSVTLEENKDYTLAYTSAVNVGTATLRVTGIEDYAGSLTKTFTIVRKDVDAFDFTMVEERAYTGDSLGAQVKLVPPMTNEGSKVTVSYDNGSGKKTAIPVNVGNYDVIIDVTAGANLTAGSDLFLGSYVITYGKLDTSCVKFSIPTGHNEAETVKFGIGNVTWKKGTGYGSFKVLYNGDTTVPKVAGVYTVSVEVTGGDNFEEGGFVLGEYRIGSVSVKGSDREVPKSVETNVAAVAPVKVVASGFTAGPSPVKTGSAIKFFSAKTVKSGTLYIFDANGNSVAKIAAKSASGEIGSWNLKDKKGVAVSEGTYVVKGALLGKDGSKEKVSFPFSVVK